jgi:hypothetical protein
VRTQAGAMASVPASNRPTLVCNADHDERAAAFRNGRGAAERPKVGRSSRTLLALLSKQS